MYISANRAPEKTEAQKYIEVLRGYYKAAAELANVERKHGDEFQRSARKHMLELDREIKCRLDDWNCDVHITHDPVIQECVRADSCWDQKCEIYFTEAGDEQGRCKYCADYARKYAREEHAR